jgi:hypothetical protein
MYLRGFPPSQALVDLPVQQRASNLKFVSIDRETRIAQIVIVSHSKQAVSDATVFQNAICQLSSMATNSPSDRIVVYSITGDHCSQYHVRSR